MHRLSRFAYAGLRMNRRSFLASSGVMLADQLLARATPARATKRAAEKAHYVLRIAPCKVEIAPGIVIDTIGYNGQVPGHYDQEIFLAIHHREPSFVPMVETMREASANAPLTPGSDVGYKYATINQHMLGAGEPIRVKRGQRVLMHLLNAGCTENVVPG
jgi:hypothetical protein